MSLNAATSGFVIVLLCLSGTFTFTFNALLRVGTVTKKQKNSKFVLNVDIRSGNNGQLEWFQGQNGVDLSLLKLLPSMSYELYVVDVSVLSDIYSVVTFRYLSQKRTYTLIFILV